MGVRTELSRRIDEALAGDPHEALIALRNLLANDLPWLERHVVGRARRDGFSWAQIGRLLGRSRQSARQRFADLGSAWRGPDRDPRDLAAQLNREGQRRLASAERRGRYRDELARWESSGDDVVPW